MGFHRPVEYFLFSRDSLSLTCKKKGWHATLKNIYKILT